MVDFEAQVTSPNSNVNPVAGVASSIADLAGDVVELAELNVRLVKADAREAGQRVIRPILLLMISLAMMIACLPVIGFGLASAVAVSFDWSLWLSQLLVGLLMAALAIAMCLGSLSRIKSAASPFQRSSTELANNVDWFKSVIKRQ